MVGDLLLSSDTEICVGWGKNDHRYKINPFDDFWNESPTHIGATYAILKYERKCQMQILRESDQNFGVLGFGMIDWFSSGDVHDDFSFIPKLNLSILKAAYILRQRKREI